MMRNHVGYLGYNFVAYVQDSKRNETKQHLVCFFKVSALLFRGDMLDDVTKCFSTFSSIY